MEILAVLSMLCGVVSAAIAHNRGASSVVWFLLGCLIGPFGVAAAFYSGPGAQCAACKKAIHKEATKCPYCQTQRAV